MKVAILFENDVFAIGRRPADVLVVESCELSVASADILVEVQDPVGSVADVVDVVSDCHRVIRLLSLAWEFAVCIGGKIVDRDPSLSSAPIPSPVKVEAVGSVVGDSFTIGKKASDREFV